MDILYIKQNHRNCCGHTIDLVQGKSGLHRQNFINLYQRPLPLHSEAMESVIAK